MMKNSICSSSIFAPVTTKRLQGCITQMMTGRLRTYSKSQPQLRSESAGHIQMETIPGLRRTTGRATSGPGAATEAAAALGEQLTGSSGRNRPGTENAHVSEARHFVMKAWGVTASALRPRR